MAITYQTRDGDMLDAICAEHYGSMNLGATVVLVLQANRGLADLGPIYSAGIRITLPDINISVAEPNLQLWD